MQVTCWYTKPSGFTERWTRWSQSRTSRWLWSSRSSCRPVSRRCVGSESPWCSRPRSWRWRWCRLRCWSSTDPTCKSCDDVVLRSSLAGTARRTCITQAQKENNELLIKIAADVPRQEIEPVSPTSLIRSTSSGMGTYYCLTSFLNDAQRINSFSLSSRRRKRARKAFNDQTAFVRATYRRCSCDHNSRWRLWKISDWSGTYHSPLQQHT